MMHVFIMDGRLANNYMCIYAPVGGMVDQLVYCNTRITLLKWTNCLLFISWDNARPFPKKLGKLPPARAGLTFGGVMCLLYCLEKEEGAPIDL